MSSFSCLRKFEIHISPRQQFESSLAIDIEGHPFPSLKEMLSHLEVSFYEALSEDDNSKVQQILCNNDNFLPDPQFFHYQFLLLCARRNIKLIRILLNDSRLDPARNQQEALKQAVINRDLELISVLMDDPRVKGGKEERELAQGDQKILVLLARK